LAGEERPARPRNEIGFVGGHRRDRLRRNRNYLTNARGARDARCIGTSGCRRRTRRGGFARGSGLSGCRVVVFHGSRIYSFPMNFPKWDLRCPMRHRSDSPAMFPHTIGQPEPDRPTTPSG
jgi:hypothetical protein